MRRKIAVIGAGNMGGAFITGMVRSGKIPPESITVVDLDAAVLSNHQALLGVRTCQQASQIVADQEVIVLALKPQIWQFALEEFKDKIHSGHLVVSMMAGVRLAAIEQALNIGCPVIRVMPNILAQVQASGSAMCAGTHAGEEHLQVARLLLETIGVAVTVREDQMDAVTGLSGSGPAYVYAMIDALADGGVKVGLSKEVALKLAVQTVLGAAKVVLESETHPAVLKDRVTSPGGTTIAGLHAMECSGFRAALMNGVEAAARRSEELGA